MKAQMPKILVAGGAGFIGSAFVRLMVSLGIRPIVVDKLTYAADLLRLKEIKGGYVFYKADVCDRPALERVFKKESPRIVVNFAAQTHVDRSILDARPFLESNVIGTQVQLEVSRKYGLSKFVHVSTDEVYGDIAKGSFNEDSSLKPNSPYAASKAAADLLIRSYIRTYNFPAVIVRPCNNYGPWQYPEKLLPLAALRLMQGGKVPIYAKGKNVREWLFVEDCCRGIWKAAQKGRIGEIYNLGSKEARKNIEVIGLLLEIFNKNKNQIEFVQDRPGHDFRYSLNCAKAGRCLGWKAQVGLEEGLELTAGWYIAHRSWLLSKWQDIRQLYRQPKAP